MAAALLTIVGRGISQNINPEARYHSSNSGINSDFLSITLIEQ
jgi:hypothetical protein